ncbi:MAG: alpha/beta hydrolase fold domain-containing protein [Mycobacterium sp.]|nr:alpha/beta hydrolase fold domain-containing protein [Mycobacterium sp.]
MDSAAQYSIDMLTAGQALLAARNLEQSNLFIAGWSAGGNQNAAFLQRLNDEGVEVSGAVIASSPLDVAATIQKGIFNPRQWDYTLPTHTGEAIWQNIALGYTAFAQGSFQDQQSVPLELFGNYYDALRRIYTQQYTALILGELTGAPGPLGLSGVTVEFTDVDGATQSEFVPYQLRSTPVVGQAQNGAIVLKYSIDEAAYNTSQYAILMRGDDPDVGNDSETGDQLWTSPARLFYGKEDEVLPPSAGQAAYDKQVAFGNQDIEITKIDNSNHRGTYLQAMANALQWFSSIAGFIITGDGVE